MKLIEKLAHKKVERSWNYEPKNDFQKLENCQIAFSEIQKTLKIPLSDLSSDAVFNCDKKTILSLFFRMILFSSLQSTEKFEPNPEEKLLFWCQNISKHYNIQVEDFSSSWCSGFALASVLHFHFPAVFSYEQLIDLSDDKVYLFLFDLMKKLEIPIFIELSDLNISQPNKNIIITQVSFLFKFFSNPSNIAKAYEKYYQSLQITINYQFKEKKGQVDIMLRQRFLDAQLLICQVLQIPMNDIIFVCQNTIVDSKSNTLISECPFLFDGSCLHLFLKTEFKKEVYVLPILSVQNYFIISNKKKKFKNPFMTPKN
jgi:hypothetical protein